MLIHNLVAATFMVTVITGIHFAGLAVLIAFIRRDRVHGASNAPFIRQAAAILFVVFGIFALHTLEIWAYAAFYISAGEFHDLEEALYFATSAFTTVGFGDITLDHDWRLFGAIESATGFIMIGWSTAFLVSVTARIRLLEAEMEERNETPTDRRAGE